MMTPEELTDIWFEQVWNLQNEACIHEHLSEDAVVRGIGEEEMRGNVREQFIEYWKATLEAMPDLRVELLRFVESGDEGMGFAQLSGTDPQTGELTSFQFGIWLRVSGHQIIEAENMLPQALRSS